MRADLILVGGRVSTLDPDRAAATAVACAGGRIVAVGSDQEVVPLAGPSTRIIAVAGRRVTPGFIDSHMHLSWLGLGLANIDLTGVRSLAALQELVRERVQGEPAGSWVLGRGWDHELLGVLPARHHLDAVAPGHPVLLTRVCGHVAVANSKALEVAGITRETPDPAGGAIDRNDRGEPTGVLREEAMELVRSRIPAPGVEELARALAAGARHTLATGITSVHSNDGTFGQGIEFVPQAYRRAREMGMRLRVWWDFPGEALPEVRERGWTSGQGDEWFRVGSAKFFADGSLGGGTAALSEPYADDPGSRGILTVDPADLARGVALAREAGIQVAVHAIGDRAIELVLDALERSGPWPTAPRMIHCQVMRADLFPRMKACGVVADLQPRFVSSDKRFAERRLGPARARLSYAWRLFLDHGIPVAFGSDCPVEPIAPMLGVFAAVTRCDTEGEPPGGWYPEHRLTVEEAVRGFTVGAARAVGEEHEKGSLTPGKLADLVVWDPDPFAVGPMVLKDVRPVLVVVGGQVVYEADPGGQ
ncbi:MAG: amidohydrolase [Firmicutes bacterium]|nr:amidohydrolase [Bacillota bacterium]